MSKRHVPPQKPRVKRQKPQWEPLHNYEALFVNEEATVEMAKRSRLAVLSVDDVTRELRSFIMSHDHHTVPGGWMSPDTARGVLALAKAIALLGELPPVAATRKLVTHSVDFPPAMAEELEKVCELAGVTTGQLVSVLVARDIVRGERIATGKGSAL